MSTYAAASSLVESSDGAHLGLETATALTPLGLVERPVFFTGLLARPEVAAAGLLAVADVAGHRYVDAGLMKRLANLDPVVTASGDRLRFEALSACNSVYARLDLLPDGIGDGEVGFGTTNVDINQPLRTALARVHGAELLHLTVGPDEVRAATPDTTHVERKVHLPDRWVRGLAEVPSIAARMEVVTRLDRDRLHALTRQLPRTTTAGATLHLVVGAGGPRLLPRGLPGALPVPGVGRLRGLDRVVRFANALTIHADPHGATAWVLDLPGARLTLTLTADPFRGFSGEGTLLGRLVHADSALAGRRLLAALGWEPVVDRRQLAETTGLAPDAIEDGLAWLGASARLGYDLAVGNWFHRELPVDGENLMRRHPRLSNAVELAETGGVRPTSRGTWMVRGSEAEHEVIVTPDGVPSCSCLWSSSHTAGRGPCKHVLAVSIVVAVTA